MAASEQGTHEPDLGTHAPIDKRDVKGKKKSGTKKRSAGGQQTVRRRLRGKAPKGLVQCGRSQRGRRGGWRPRSGNTCSGGGAGESAVAGWPHVNRCTRCTRRGGRTRWATAQVRRGWHLRRQHVSRGSRLVTSAGGPTLAYGVFRVRQTAIRIGAGPSAFNGPQLPPLASGRHEMRTTVAEQWQGPVGVAVIEETAM